MRKGKDILSMLFLGGMLLIGAASCQKEQTVPLQQDVQEGECELTLHFAIAQNLTTRANVSSSIALTDELKRLDLYLFYENNDIDKAHIAVIPEDRVIPSVKVKEKKGVRVGVLAIGNLDPDTAAYLEPASLEDLNSLNTPEGRIVLSAGNFAYDRIPMLGNCLYTFNDDGSRTIELTRLMYRIDVEDVVVDFDNPDLLGKKVELRNIAIINTMNVFAPVHSTSIGHFYSTYATFGNYYTGLSGTFGGVTSGYDYYPSSYNNYSGLTASVTYNGPGKLNGTKHPDFFNVNYKVPAGELHIDAEGIFLDSTYQHYDEGTAVIVPAGDMAQRHSFNVGRCFYGLFAQSNFNRSIVCDYNDQYYIQKLVFELEIDGDTYFYPIQLYDIQPNTVYRIEKVTVRDFGSKYSNFYEKKYQIDFAVSIKPWETLDIDNFNVGADPVTGQPVSDPNQGIR